MFGKKKTTWTDWGLDLVTYEKPRTIFQTITGQKAQREVKPDVLFQAAKIATKVAIKIATNQAPTHHDLQ